MADILNRVREIWNNMTLVRRIILIGGVALVIIIAGVIIILSSSQGKMVPLYSSSSMTTADAAAIVEQLESMGYTEGKGYTIGTDGVTIYVPEDNVSSLRMTMATNELVPEAGIGYEIFDNTSFAMTESDREIALTRAMQGELERTINSLEAVEYSKVLVNMPKDSLFSSEQQNGSVAVMIKLKAGKTLDEMQIKGMAMLISRSVKGVNPEDVVIMDTQSNELTAFLQENDATFSSSATAQKNYQQKKTFEKDLAKEVQSMLEKVVGTDKVKVVVSADLNFDAKEQTVIRYDNPQLRSLQREFQAAGGTVVPIGPGPVDINTQYFLESTTGQGVSTDYYNTKENFELNSDTTNTIAAPGGVDRMTVAVVVDGTFNEQELEAFRGMVQAASGFDQVRGDYTYVTAATWDHTAEETAKTEFEKEQKRYQLTQTITMIAQYLGVAGAIALLLVTFFTLRRRLNRTQAILDEEDAAEMEVYLANQQAMQPITVDEIIDESPKLKPEKEDITEKEIKQFANDSPDKVADIIKTWVLKDEG